MRVHNKGWKGDRDRADILGHYARITKFFKVKRLTDLELSRLGNQALYNLGNDIFNQQSLKDRRRYMERYCGIGYPKYRINPGRFKWAYIDARKAHGRVKALFIALSNRHFQRKAAKKAVGKNVAASNEAVKAEGAK